MVVRVLGKVWLTGLLCLGLVVGLLGAAPPVAVGTHGDDADVDFEASYSACVGAATESFGFEDTVGSFAEEAIDCLAHYGITTGRSPTMFAPNESVLRWQMALFLARAAATAGIVLANPAADQGFTDIGAVSEEARNAINGLAAAEIMPGTSQTTFSPNASVNRGSMAMLLDAFLSKAALGAGAFGGEVEKYSDVKADNFRVFNDINTVSLSTYNAIYRIYEAGVTQGIGDHQFGPGRNVTRAQMAAFITRAFAHTVARPAGVSIQADKDSVLGETTVQLIVSVRDARFQPVVDASVDAFRSADPDDAFKDDGTCDTANVSRVAGVGRAACEVDTGDETTDEAGDVTALQLQVSDADATVWAWTGDREDKFDSDDTASAQLTVEFSKAASQTLVTDDLEEGQTRLAFGETVTVTIQIADDDDKAVADRGKQITVAQQTVRGNERSTSTDAMTTDASGRIVLEFTQPDPTTNTGDTAELTLTLSGAPTDLPLRDKDGAEFTSATYTWSDEAPVPRALTLSTRSDFAMASDEGRGAGNTVTATLTDQFGEPVRGKTISFLSDTYCMPAAGSTCSPSGIGAEESGGVTSEEDDGVRILTGTARFTRTTGRDGRANLGYTYDSTDSLIETIWATYQLEGSEGVEGVADGSAGRPAGDPDDLTALTTDRLYYYWVEEPSGAPFTGRILVKEPDNNRLVVAAKERLMLVQYDANDQLIGFDGPTVMSEFEKPLAEGAERAGAHLRVDFYQKESGKVSKMALSPEWPRLDHPDGMRLGGGARFGQAMAVDNGVIVVGASYETIDPDTGATDVDDDADETNDASDDLRRAGMVYIYPDGIDTAPADIVKLSAPTPIAMGRFGWDVDISGDTVVVGTFGAFHQLGSCLDSQTTPPCSETDDYKGEVYIYESTNGEWGTSPAATLSRGSTLTPYSFGQAVAISSDESTIAVAMPHCCNVPGPSRVFAYEKPGTGWADDADASDDPQLSDSSHPWLRLNVRGLDISGDGEVIVVSAVAHFDAGVVQTWVRPGAFGTWVDATDAEATLIAKGGINDRQAMAKYVAVDDAGETIIASGHYDAGVEKDPRTEGANPGQVYVFSKPDAGWAGADENADAAAVLRVTRGRMLDVFGQYIDISADGSEIASSRHYRQEGDFRGSVAVFKKPAGGWADDSTPDDEFLGAAPNDHLGWQPAFDKENGDLYSGIRNETTIKDPLPSNKLLSIFKISR